MTYKEHVDCCNALREWFKSQGLEPHESVNVLIVYLGFMIAQNATSANELIKLVEKTNAQIGLRSISEYVTTNAKTRP